MLEMLDWHGMDAAAETRASFSLLGWFGWSPEAASGCEGHCTDDRPSIVVVGIPAPQIKPILACNLASWLFLLLLRSLPLMPCCCHDHLVAVKYGGLHLNFHTVARPTSLVPFSTPGKRARPTYLSIYTSPPAGEFGRPPMHYTILY